MATILVDGVRLVFEEQGQGTPILCIHGTGSSRAVWSSALQPLAALGRVIAYDRRGCAHSERPDPYLTTSVSEHAEDAATLLRERDAWPAVVIGRSYGGEVALELARSRPDLVRALVLLEPAILTLSPETQAWFDGLTAEVNDIARADGPGAAAEQFYRRVIGDATWESFPDEFRATVRGNGPAILAELNGAVTHPDDATLADVRVPVLIVSGDSSPAAFRRVGDLLTAMIPMSRHEVVGGGHMVDPASPVVLDFVRQVVAPD